MEKGIETTLMKTYAAFVIVLLMWVCPLHADLVGLWQFDEGTGTVAADGSGYGHDGTLAPGLDGVVGGVTTPSTEPRWITRPGDAGSYALEFGTPDSGTPGPLNDDRNWNTVDVAYAQDLATLGNRWSMAAWIRQDQNASDINIGSAYARIISCPNYEIELGVPGDLNDYFWPYFNGSWQFSMGATQGLGSWYHLAVTYDGTTFRKYINGTEVFTQTSLPASLPSNWGPGLAFGDGIPMRFGGQTDPEKSYLIGALDDVAIWNEALDPNEITAVMGGDFSGPWDVSVPETTPASLLFNSTFIYEYSARQLAPGEFWFNHTPWNWNRELNQTDANLVGIENVSLWDGGNINPVKYAAYCTVGDFIYQEANPAVGAWQPVMEGITYNLSARVAGFNAVGNIVGVEFYVVESSDPNVETLIADLNTTVTQNQTWADLSAQFTATAADDGDFFKAVAYIDQGTGNGPKAAYGYFDSIVIAVDSAATCAGVQNLGQGIASDLTGDCFVNYGDFEELGSSWQSDTGAEPDVSGTELLANADFYQDIARAPNAYDFDGGAPTGWKFVPDTSDSAIAGVWNLSQAGLFNVADLQPAGGSVAAYIDPNVVWLEQTATAPVVNGQTYYLSAMVAGTADAYQNLLQVEWHLVDAVENPTTATVIAKKQMVAPNAIIWRKLTHEFTANASQAGKFIRIRCKNAKTNLIPENDGPMVIGKASIDTVKPADWPRRNFLVNGDFEDVSNLSEADQFTLLATYDGYTSHTTLASTWPPSWTYGDGFGAGYQNGTSNGMQCMLWAPPGQPVQGRVSIWLDANFPNAQGPGTFGPVSKLYQKVTMDSIQSGVTYYLDFVACIAWSQYNSGGQPFPDPNPEIHADLYWIDPLQSNLTGTQGVHWDYITSADAIADAGLGGNGGHWQVGQASFTATSAMAGKNFFVVVYGDAPYVTIEEVVLSDEAPITIGPYTCDEAIALNGAVPGDFNSDCKIGLEDVNILAQDWAECNDPEDVSCN